MSTSGDEAWFSSLLLKENVLSCCIYMFVALSSWDKCHLLFIRESLSSLLCTHSITPQIDLCQARAFLRCAIIPSVRKSAHNMIYSLINRF